MMTNNHGSAQSLTKVEGNMTDAELNTISGGDKKTTTTKPTTTTTKPIEYMTYTMQDVLVSSY
jgi:hypothetical protein